MNLYERQRQNRVGGERETERVKDRERQLMSERFHTFIAFEWNTFALFRHTHCTCRAAGVWVPAYLPGRTHTMHANPFPIQIFSMNRRRGHNFLALDKETMEKNMHNLTVSWYSVPSTLSALCWGWDTHKFPLRCGIIAEEVYFVGDHVYGANVGQQATHRHILPCAPTMRCKPSPPIAICANKGNGPTRPCL